jgi:Zn finger protein HypA/HybF involved in hydrogenase expression
VVAAEEVAAVNLVLGNLTKVLPEQLEPHKELLAKAEVVVMEPAAVVEAADKMVVLAVDWSPATTAAFQVKMATVWHPEVV